MKKSSLVTAIIVTIWCLAADAAQAQAPNLINYQGRLTATGGAAASGSFAMTFSIYATATGVTPVWTETQTVTVANGVFNVLLGSVTTLSSTLFTSGGDRYLGIKVGTDPEMTPRFRLTSVAFAFHATEADGIKDGAIGDAEVSAGAAIAGVKINPDFGSQNIFTTGRVSIGSTPDPNPNIIFDVNIPTGGFARFGRALSVTDVQFTNGHLRSEQSRFQIIGQNFFGAGQQITFGQAAGDIDVIIDTNGSVGIGTTAPIADGRLTIHAEKPGLSGTEDVAYFGNSSTSAYVKVAFEGGTGGIGAHSQGRDFHLFVNGLFSRGLRIQGTTGNVGIGTTSPKDKLHVAGAARVDTLRFPDGSLQTTAAAGGSGGLTLPFSGTTASSNDAFAITTTGAGRVANFEISNSNNNLPALLSRTKGSGRAAEFGIENPNNNNITLFAYTNGLRSAGYFFNDNVNNVFPALEANTSGSGAAIKGTATANGVAGLFEGRVVVNGNVGIGTTNPDPKAKLHINGAPGVDGILFPDGTFQKTAFTGSGGGFSLPFSGTNTSNNTAFEIMNTGTANAGVFETTNSGNAEAALFAGTNGTGNAGVFEIDNSGNAETALYVGTNGIGSALVADHTGPSGDIAVFQTSGANKARIDRTGKGFFNGGTQTGGADVAEAFEVENEINTYSPGEVLVISTNNDRRVEKCRAPYSTLVIGVYATKPGVLLSERDIEADLSDTIPVGVVGVIPTKVSGENGPIRRGDLLVTSSTPGHAMKGTDRERMFGATLGKALENFDGSGTGIIKVLVNAK